MSIRKNSKRKKNPWECRWSEDGKHYSRSFHTRKEAEQFDAERKTALNSVSGYRTKDEKVTLDNYAEKFLSQKKKPLTVLRNSDIYKRHIQPTLGAIPIRQIRPYDIQKLTDSWVEKGLSPRTIQRQLAVASAIFAIAVFDGIIPRLPTKGISRPEAEEPHRYAMTVAEVSQLRSAIHPNYEAFIYVLVETGMRIGEAISLNIGNFDWSKRTLNITAAKTRAGIRSVRISETAQYLINDHIVATGRTMANQEEPLFVSHKTDKVTGLVTGSRIIYSNFRTRIFKPAASFIGLPELLPHDLRRTAATLQVGSGTPHKVVQERLGHADIRTTLNLYAQATGEAHTEAVLRMEETLNPPTSSSSDEEDVA
jgi:integrase